MRCRFSAGIPVILGVSLLVVDGFLSLRSCNVRLVEVGGLWSGCAPGGGGLHGVVVSPHRSLPPKCPCGTLGVHLAAPDRLGGDIFELRPAARSALTAICGDAPTLEHSARGLLRLRIGCLVHDVRRIRAVAVDGRSGEGFLGFGLAAFAIVPQALSSSLLSVDQYYGSGCGSIPAVGQHPVQRWIFAPGISISGVRGRHLDLRPRSRLAWLLPSRRRSEAGARAAVIGAVICVVVATKPAGLVWEALPLLAKFQFPWRVASLLTFGLAFIVASPRSSTSVAARGLVVAVSLPFSGWTRTQPSRHSLLPEPPRPPAGTVFPDPYVAWEAGSGGWYWRHHNLAEIWFLARQCEAVSCYPNWPATGPANSTPFATDRRSYWGIPRRQPVCCPGDRFGASSRLRLRWLGLSCGVPSSFPR